MKHRTLYSNICSIVIILALVMLLLAYSGVVGGGRDTKTSQMIITCSIVVTIAATALFEFVLPIVDNKKYLKNGKYLVRAVVKTILFAASMILIVLTLYSKLPAAMNEMVAIGIFVVLYFAQFFINLDRTFDKKETENGSAEVKNEGTSES